MPHIDDKANKVFGGRVVRKDLVRQLKAGALVPVFVLEDLLGKYCATDDPAAIDIGLVLSPTNPTIHAAPSTHTLWGKIAYQLATPRASLPHA